MWKMSTCSTCHEVIKNSGECQGTASGVGSDHDDVIKLKHFPRYWPFAQGIHRSLVNSPHKDQWRGALTFCLFCAWTNNWANNGNLRHRHAHDDVIGMTTIAELFQRDHRHQYIIRQTLLLMLFMWPWYYTASLVALCLDLFRFRAIPCGHQIRETHNSACQLDHKSPGRQ